MHHLRTCVVEGSRRRYDSLLSSFSLCMYLCACVCVIISLSLFLCLSLDCSLLRFLVLHAGCFDADITAHCGILRTVVIRFASLISPFRIYEFTYVHPRLPAAAQRRGRVHRSLTVADEFSRFLLISDRVPAREMTLNGGNETLISAHSDRRIFQIGF